MGTLVRRATGRRSSSGARRWDAALPTRSSPLAVRNAPRACLYPASHFCGQRCRLRALSSSGRVPGTHRQRQAGTTGERRATSTDHFGAAGAASTDCRGSDLVEGCGWTPVAAQLDGALAPANGDAGRLPRQLVSTGSSPSCGSLPPTSELARASGAQCARATSRDQHPGHGGRTAHPGSPSAALRSADGSPPSPPATRPGLLEASSSRVRRPEVSCWTPMGHRWDTDGTRMGHGWGHGPAC
jgi:hypothetical protein